MGKSLKELFQTKVLESGQTAAKQYDIRDSKDILITPGNSLLGLPFKAANVLRRRFGARLSESFFEEEATGLRIINKLSGPIIYGTDVFRLSTQSTDMVTTMKGGTGTTAGDRGIVGNLINKGKIILYDFFTFEEYRNKGYYFKNILNIATFFKEKDLYIYTTFLNAISKKAILKSGFNLNKILFYFTKSYTL
jgi:hypothetical protein